MLSGYHQPSLYESLSATFLVESAGFPAKVRDGQGDARCTQLQALDWTL